MPDSLGDRMKGYYENMYRVFLTRRTPVIIRLDMRAGHSYTRGFARPYDIIFKRCMWETKRRLCKNIQNARFGYVQSDEISILLIDYESIDTEAWFGNNLQKIVSISASMATLYFNQAMQKIAREECADEEQLKMYLENPHDAMFDSRAFNIPESDITNYFIWRQQDATRNSIEIAGRCYFSDKQLYKVNCKQIQDKLFTEKGVNWNDFPTFFKRGVCAVTQDVVVDNVTRKKWVIDTEIPIFTQDRGYVDKSFDDSRETDVPNDTNE